MTQDHSYLVTPRHVLGSDSEAFFASSDTEALTFAAKWASRHEIKEYEVYRQLAVRESLPMGFTPTQAQLEYAYSEGKEAWHWNAAASNPYSATASHGESLLHEAWKRGYAQDVRRVTP